MRSFGAALALLFAVGCGEAGAARDAGVDAGALTIEAPADVEPPRGACPSGWAPADPERGLGCTAYPSGRVACGSQEAQRPGAVACTPVGDPCAPHVAPATGRAIWVEIGGSGDGTEGAPFGSLAEAIGDAGDGDVILLGEGSFVADAIVVSPRITIRGLCPASTAIVSDVPSNLALLSAATELHLAQLRFSGPRNGVYVASGARLDVSGCAFVDVEGIGVAVDGAATVEDTVFSVTTLPSADRVNAGVIAAAGGQATIRRCAFRGLADVGVRANGAGARITIEGSVFDPGARDAADRSDLAVDVQAGASGEVTTTAVLGAEVVGVLARGAGSMLTVRAVEVTGAAADGVAVLAVGGATLHAEQLTARDSPSGVAAFDVGTELTVTDSAVLRSGEGTGVWFADAEGSVLRTAIVGSGFRGLLADTATVTLEDVLIVESGREDQTYAADDVVGAAVFEGSDVTVVRMALDDNDLFGITIYGGVANLQDVRVERMKSHPDLGHAIGVLVHAGASATLERVLLADNMFLGVGAFGVDTELHLRSATLERTVAGVCYFEDCNVFAGGIALGVYSGARADVHTFVVRGSELAAAQVAFGYEIDQSPSVNPGALDLHHGVIEDNLVGVSVQVDAYDFERLLDDVRYVDNERNLDAMTLPVPRPRL